MTEKEKDLKFAKDELIEICKEFYTKTGISEPIKALNDMLINLLGDEGLEHSEITSFTFYTAHLVNLISEICERSIYIIKLENESKPSNSSN